MSVFRIAPRRLVALALLFGVPLMAAPAGAAETDRGMEGDLDSYLATADLSVLRAADTPGASAYLAADKPKKRWHGAAEIYLWIPLFASGSSSVPDDSGSSSVPQRAPAQSTGDLVDLDGLSGFIIPIRTQWWFGKWGIKFELMYADLDLDGSLFGRLDVPFDLDLQFWFIDLGVSYMALKPEPGKQPWLIDIFVGARFVDLEQRLAVGSTSNKASESYVEPWVGVNFGYVFNKRWALLLRIEGSGFGVGDASDLTYGAQFGAIWRFGKKQGGTLSFGWRFMGINFDAGDGDRSHRIDIHLNGPYIGVGFDF